MEELAALYRSVVEELAPSLKTAPAGERARLMRLGAAGPGAGWETVDVSGDEPHAWTALAMSLARCGRPARALELTGMCLTSFQDTATVKWILDAACRSAAAAGDLGTARGCLAVLEALARDTGRGDLPQEARREVAALVKKARKGSGAGAPSVPGKGGPGKGGPGKGGRGKGQRGGGGRRR
jgi:hypothetical protein